MQVEVLLSYTILTCALCKDPGQRCPILGPPRTPFELLVAPFKTAWILSTRGKEEMLKQKFNQAEQQSLTVGQKVYVHSALCHL